LRTGGGEYRDEPERTYHFKKEYLVQCGSEVMRIEQDSFTSRKGYSMVQVK